MISGTLQSTHLTPPFSSEFAPKFPILYSAQLLYKTFHLTCSIDIIVNIIHQTDLQLSWNSHSLLSSTLVNTTFAVNGYISPSDPVTLLLLAHGAHFVDYSDNMNRPTLLLVTSSTTPSSKKDMESCLIKFFAKQRGVHYSSIISYVARNPSFFPQPPSYVPKLLDGLRLLIHNTSGIDQDLRTKMQLQLGKSNGLLHSSSYFVTFYCLQI